MRAYLTCPVCQRRYHPPAEHCPEDGSPLYGAEVLARVGTTLRGYRIDGVLGQGGMAVVYLAEHVLLRRKVAVKVMHARLARRPGAAAQFLREARAASRVRHPNVCDVTDLGVAEDGAVFFAMEHLDGESLEDLLEREGRLSLFRALNVALQLAGALHAVHDHGLVHQDLKPENVFLTSRPGRRRLLRRLAGPEGAVRDVVAPEGAYDLVKLLDFGVAQRSGEPPPDGELLFGTPQYMSPEQCLGEPVDPRSDVYALGVLLYEMLAGELPFDADDPVEVMRAHVEDPPPPLPVALPGRDGGAAARETVARCLAKAPGDRFPDMEALRAALARSFTDVVHLRHARGLPGDRRAAGEG